MNTALAQQLIAMAEEDRRVLLKLFESGELPSDAYPPQMQTLHERQTAALKAIICSHGWPGTALVGHEAAKAAWVVVGRKALCAGAAVLYIWSKAVDLRSRPQVCWPVVCCKGWSCS